MALDTTRKLKKVTYNGVQIPFAAVEKGEHRVQVIDYDGTIIDEAYLNTGDTYALPQAPTHDRLTFQRYCGTVEITGDTIVVGDGDIMIGALYETTSGLSEFDVDVNEATGLAITLNMDGTKDWGDGTIDTATSHIYASRGAYTITCDGTTMTTSSSSGLFGNINNQYTGGVVNYTVKHIRLASRVASIADYAFSNCRSLQTITIPYGVTYLGHQSFEYCNSIRTIIFPSGTNPDTNYLCRSTDITKVLIPYGWTKISYNYFNSTKLRELTLPESLATIDNSAFNGCRQLQKVNFPKNLKTIWMNAFSNCSSLEEIKLSNDTNKFGYNCFDNLPIKKFKYPNTLTSIPEIFDYCFSLVELDFTEFTSVPMLPSTDNIDIRNKGMKIYVPDALYDQWIAATNWASLSGHIYKASEMAE